MRELTYGILASGKLGAICTSKIISQKKISCIFTDKLSYEIIELGKISSIPVFIGSPRNGRAQAFLIGKEIDVLISINYIFIVEQDILNYPKKFAINIHGSLLPKYRGRTPHVWAIINNEQETGITAHLMSEKCDEGDIIYQEKFAISDCATGGSLLNEFNHRYPKVVSKIIEMIESDTIELISQDDTKATYFEKRTPEDGEINWNWQKERIKNWVRALSKPYPGAFTFYKKEKVIINRIEFSDLGFHQNDMNGKILKCENDFIFVKTSNGVIVLKDIETRTDIKFEEGEKFICRTL